MSTLADWMRWVPGDPLPVGPVTDIQTGGAAPRPYLGPGVTSEQLRVVMEAPAYVAPTVPSLNLPTTPEYIWAGSNAVPGFEVVNNFVPMSLPTLPGDRLTEQPPQGNAAAAAPAVYAEAFPPAYMAAMEPPAYEIAPPLYRQALEIAPPLIREEPVAPPSFINRSLQLQMPSIDTIRGVIDDVRTIVSTGREILGGPGSQTTVTQASPCASGMRLVGSVCTPSTSGSPGASGGGAGQWWSPTNLQVGGGGVPAGQTATPADVQAVMGRFGVAYTPYVAGNIGGRPILRCLVRGTILGMDNLCYNKRDLRRTERKWKPPARPLLTGGEMNALRKVGSIRKRLKKAAGVADLSCAKKGCNCKRTPAKGRK